MRAVSEKLETQIQEGLDMEKELSKTPSPAKQKPTNTAFNDTKPPASARFSPSPRYPDDSKLTNPGE